MEFNNALFFLKQGRKVRRKAWNNEKYMKKLSVLVGDSVNENLYIMINEQVVEPADLTNDEILANDWELV